SVRVSERSTDMNFASHHIVRFKKTLRLMQADEYHAASGPHRFHGGLTSDMTAHRINRHIHAQTLRQLMRQRNRVHPTPATFPPTWRTAAMDIKPIVPAPMMSTREPCSTPPTTAERTPQAKGSANEPETTLNVAGSRMQLVAGAVTNSANAPERCAPISFRC